jgi:bacterioferritin-associated ferredoxin
VYVCSCFGITEADVRRHAAEGRCSPRAIASNCRAGTDCGSCVRRIQALLGRTASPATATASEAGAPPVRAASVNDAPSPAPAPARPASPLPACAAAPTSPCAHTPLCPTPHTSPLSRRAAA